MKKNMQRLIKALNGICGIIGGVVFLGILTILLLGYRGFISEGTLIIGLIVFNACWWSVYGIKYLAERRLINGLRKWAQHVVDTNYYNGQKITVDYRKGVWFSGPEDKWFTRKFTARCREVFQNTGMKIYYNYSWIMM